MEVLHTALHDGRIDPEEHAERGERVAEARTLGELAAVTSDLLPSERQPIQLRSAPVMAVFRSERHSGRWVMPGRSSAFALFGTAELDLREALFTHSHVRINASSLFGRIEIQVPEDVEVRVRGWTFLGRRRTTTRPPRSEDPAVLELEGFSVLGSLRVRTPKRKRFWLRRRPSAE